MMISLCCIINGKFIGLVFHQKKLRKSPIILEKTTNQLGDKCCIFEALTCIYSAGYDLIIA
jgi:hypothetical protein